jgi:hypothetical protein
MKQHLAKCIKWIKSLPEASRESLLKAPTAHDPQRRITEMTTAFQKKTTAEINRLVGMAIFAGARPFSSFESVEMKMLFQALNFNVPSRNQLSTTILEDCYAQVKLDVEKQISKAQYLNVTVDESTDIRKRRIANISVTDGRRSYCVASKDIGDTSMSATACADWILEQVKHFITFT